MDTWTALAHRQSGLIARRQLSAAGIEWHRVQSHLDAGRWAARSPRVISTFTGPMTTKHRAWLGVLHAGGHSLVGGLTAAAIHGLQGWSRPDTTILVNDDVHIDPLPGIRFVRTRRPLVDLRCRSSELALCAIEPAILLFAAYVPSRGSAYGAVAAVVQQRLTTPARLSAWIERMQPLRRAAKLRDLLREISTGAQSWNEARFGRLCDRYGLQRPRRQTMRRRSGSTVWFTDCEWDIPGGATVVLEIDGPVHMDARRWSADMARQRGITAVNRPVLRCTTVELRENAEGVIADLRRAGVPSAPSAVQPGRSW